MYFFTDQKRKFRTIFNFLALIVLISISAVSFAAAENSAKQDSPSASNSVEASADNDKASVSIQSLNKAAFGSMAQTMLPMSPEQIKRLRGLFNQTQAAAATTPGTPPRPTISSQYVKLEPGATPTVIRLAEGYVTTLAFLDSTGQSWPVDNYDIGNPQAFNIQWDKKSNLLMIQATSLYNVGNLAVQLRGLETPVMVTLISGQKAVDYRVDLRVPGNGPNAKALLGRNLPQSADPALLNILEGVPPPGNTALKISGGLAQAWLAGDHLYLRTRLTLISPAWISTMSSPDGMKAYEMPKTPLILGFEDGQSIQLKVEGF
ncbi:DotH/IcmK family type IV secretion protein [Rickettsiella endosymbiont of Litargus connexus]|jgi:intracellular multiplication protein IcmK|uniref:DotH/IcmK family type IV secretion protein n=1 Tax=Rickettsiella endosymbiont of Litargus connexus TaxID=3066237 RepID=UPI0027E92F8A|nr:DotH/IcmK family type IV secretion protein [Gammaproteobacteria bacterium]MCH9754850.1 DotH/IcmK family type IV secretion protein [Gammaproteobacteria bacterium]MDD5161766.1 DotH/IcmK family type IV secretion protein [Candidatus Rickettsiella isopodorum]MDQ5899244.1 intracellular multiplication protein IcmK [Pseudomonadota bacterium]